MTSRRELELVDEVQARAANRGSRPMPGFGQSAFLIVIRTYVVVLPNPWDLRQSPANTSPTRNCGLSLFFTRLSLQPLQVCASRCQRSPFRVDGEARHPRDVVASALATGQSQLNSGAFGECRCGLGWNPVQRIL